MRYLFLSLVAAFALACAAPMKGRRPTETMAPGGGHEAGRQLEKKEAAEGLRPDDAGEPTPKAVDAKKKEDKRTRLNEGEQPEEEEAIIPPKK